MSCRCTRCGGRWGRPARKRRSASARFADPGVGARARRRHAVVQPARADPAVRRGRRRRPAAAGATFVDAVTNQQTLAALRLTVLHLGRRHRAQHGDGHDHRLGAGPRPVLGQGRPRRGHRHPVRAADDRRRPGAARRSTGRPARSASTSQQHPRRGLPRASRS